jgi:hypothetical protein
VSGTHSHTAPRFCAAPVLQRTVPCQVELGQSVTVSLQCLHCILYTAYVTLHSAHVLPALLCVLVAYARCTSRWLSPQTKFKTTTADRLELHAEPFFVLHCCCRLSRKPWHTQISRGGKCDSLDKPGCRAAHAAASRLPWTRLCVHAMPQVSSSTSQVV